MKSIPIGEGSVVSIHYTLTLEDGSIVDSSKGSEPLAYLHGGGNIVPGLERQLAGKAAGTNLTAVVPAAEGYGEFDPDAEQELPLSAFPKDAKLAPGMQFMTEDPNGSVHPLWVKAVAGDKVTITENHPLAGQTLNFAIEIVSVRKATKEELQHGHPHGEGGHHH